MTLNKLHQELGQVQGELKGLREDVTEMKGQLATACAYIERQKGARRATIFISSGASAVVAAIVGWAVSWFGGQS